MCKLVSKEFAKKWYDIGVKYSHLDSLNTAIKSAINNNDDIDCWEKSAAFRAGYKGYTFNVEPFERYGNINVGQDGYAERSVNHAQNEPEIGVSVITPEWSNSLVGRVSYEEFKRDGVKKIKISGLVVGYGSDNEKLILPIQI